MEVIKTELNDVFIIKTEYFNDSRGWFSEVFSQRNLIENGINFDPVQENHSCSLKKGTIRGLHFQTEPMAQAKLVRCTRGEILDIVVDIRIESPTFKKWISIKLTEYNGLQVYIPKGFAHGFLSLADNTHVQYIVDQYYSPQNDRCIRYNDKDLNIHWGIDNPIISNKDNNAPFLNDINTGF